MNPRLPSRLWPHLFALGVGLYFFNAFHFGKSWGLLEGAGVTAFQMAAAVLIDRRLRRDLWRRPGPAWPMAAVAGAVLAAVLAVWMTRRLSWSQPLIATLAAGGSRALSRFYAAAYRSRPRENHEEGIRWLVLLAGALFLIGPYATTRFVGAGDAVHYARQLADFLAQVRAWVFPVFVGQSLSAFGGDVHPLRTAPYFQYAGGLLDLLTGFSLNAISLQNLLIVLSFVAAVFTCYWTLAGIAGVRRWTLVWLALLFASSPGVLALIYGGDMVSAWLTLPWLPLLFSGWARTWREADPARGLAQQAVALAMIWLANAPIAIWAALLTATNECIRLVVRERSRASGFISAGAAALCLLLCQYVFVSVATLDAPENPYLTHALKHGLITNVLKDSWAGPLRLVSAGGDRLLTDLHLSPGLWVAVLFGATGLRVRKWPVGTMTALLALLTFLLIPWGPFTGAFWSHLPSFVLTITEKWPEQRFYPLLSAMIPFLAAQGLACSPWYRGRAAIAATFALALGVGWSAREVMKFRNRGNSVMRTEEATGRLLFPENNQLSRYSYEMWGRLPRTFSFAHMDPLEQVRLLDKTGLNVVDSNILAVLRDQARVPAAPQLRYIAMENGGHFVPDIRLQPGQIRLLEFDFKKPGPGGVLQITGQRTHHEYQLPSASEKGAFGSGPGQPCALLIGYHGEQAEQITVRFIRAKNALAFPLMIDAKTRVINPDRLPFRVRSLIPYVLDADLRQDGLLETPKLLIPGYRATVDGKVRDLARSPDNLAALPLAAGRHVVRIEYDPPLLLVFSFWLNLGALAACVILALGPLPRLRAARWNTAIVLNRLGKWSVACGLAALAAHGAAGYVHQRNRPGPPPGTIRLKVVFPVGRHEVYEPLLAMGGEQGNSTTIVAFYESDKYVRIGCRKNGVLKILTDEQTLPVSYFVPHVVEVFSGALLRESDRAYFGNPDDSEWDTLRHTLRVEFNHHRIWETDTRHQRGSVVRTAVGRDPFDPGFANETFRGRVLLAEGMARP